MKKIIFSAILAVAAIACSKESLNEEYPSLVGINSPESYFLPAYVNEQDAPPLALNQPIILQYYSKYPTAGDFVIREGNVFLARVAPEVDHITASAGPYYPVNFPLGFRVPELWAGKLITISADDGTKAFTLFRVMELPPGEVTY